MAKPIATARQAGAMGHRVHVFMVLMMTNRTMVSRSVATKKPRSVGNWVTMVPASSWTLATQAPC